MQSLIHLFSRFFQTSFWKNKKCVPGAYFPYRKTNQIHCSSFYKKLIPLWFSTTFTLWAQNKLQLPWKNYKCNYKRNLVSSISIKLINALLWSHCLFSLWCLKTFAQFSTDASEPTDPIDSLMNSPLIFSPRMSGAPGK